MTGNGLSAPLPGEMEQGIARGERSGAEFGTSRGHAEEEGTRNGLKEGEAATESLEV